jgi:hypothetical protein
VKRELRWISPPKDELILEVNKDKLRDLTPLQIKRKESAKTGRRKQEKMFKQNMEENHGAASEWTSFSRTGFPLFIRHVPPLFSFLFFHQREEEDEEATPEVV